jgi:hypothetical protein
VAADWRLSHDGRNRSSLALHFAGPGGPGVPQEVRSMIVIGFFIVLLGVVLIMTIMDW